MNRGKDFKVELPELELEEEINANDVVENEIVE